MGQYLIDNNVISHYFSATFTAAGMAIVSEVIDQVPNISVITQIEALSWINPDKSKELIVQRFVADANILDLNRDIISACIGIRRSRKIKTPDAIIAATAIVNRLTLITSDAGFKGIPKLEIIDPHSL